MEIHDILKIKNHRPCELPNESWSFYQEWNNAIFLHFKVELEELKQYIPKELEIDLFENDESVLKFTKPKLTILDNGKFYIKSNIIVPKDPTSPLKYRFDGQIDKNLISGKIQIIYNGNEMPGMVLLELETREKSVFNFGSSV